MTVTTAQISNSFDLWVKVFNLLASGSSVLLHAPRHYRKKRFTEQLLGNLRKSALGTAVYLHISECSSAGSLNYAELWEVTRQQLGSGLSEPVTTKFEFLQAALALLSKRVDPITFVAAAAGVGSESIQFSLVSLLHELRDELPIDRREVMRLFILDDYSLYYYETAQKSLTSKWDLERLHQRALSQSEVESILCTSCLFADTTSNAIQAAAKTIIEVTGGHVGLVVELADHCLLRHIEPDPDYVSVQGAALLSKSNILESIRKGLSQDPQGLTEVALHYAGGRIPTDYSNPNVQLLRQLGVVQWTSSARAELCPGVISDLVRAIHAALDTEPSRPLGTLASEFGPRVYDRSPERLIADDDDFIIVHLSDLHVGESYPFRMSRPIRDRRDEDKRSVAELLAADLRSLGLDNRLDLLVISGDFTDRASMDEFRRAREVVNEILNAVGLDRSRLLVVAGNHDVEWKPSSLSHVESLSMASRENYQTFRELLGFQADQIAEVRLLQTRSGRHSLRLLAIDSNLVEGPEFAGVGFVSRDCLDESERALSNNKHVGNAGITGTWLVLHHHVFPVSSIRLEDVTHKKLTVLANAPEILGFADRYSIEVILHGHEHQPSVTVSRRWPSTAPLDFRALVTVGAGSFSGARPMLGPFSRNQYYVIYRKPDHMIIRSRSISDLGVSFVMHNDMLIPLKTTKPTGSLDAI